MVNFNLVFYCPTFQGFIKSPQTGVLCLLSVGVTRVANSKESRGDSKSFHKFMYK